MVIWKLAIIWDVLAVIIGVSFMLKTTIEIIYQQLIKEFNVDDERPFIFKIWLPNYDVNRSPVYELFLAFDYLVLFSVMITFMSKLIFSYQIISNFIQIIIVIFFFVDYINLIVQFIVHSIGQFDIISLNFNEMFEFMDDKLTSSKLKKITLKRKMKSIVKRHQKILS